MNLAKKKLLVARTLNVGKSRIVFNNERISEIKEVITKQDVRDMLASGAISIKEIRGTKKVKKSVTRRRAGSIRKRVKSGKTEYIQITRKLRAHLATLKRTGKITLEIYSEFRKKIRAREFKSLNNMKERLSEESK